MFTSISCKRARLTEAWWNMAIRTLHSGHSNRAAARRMDRTACIDRESISSVFFSQVRSYFNLYSCLHRLYARASATFLLDVTWSILFTLQIYLIHNTCVHTRLMPNKKTYFLSIYGVSSPSVGPLLIFLIFPLWLLWNEPTGAVTYVCYRLFTPGNYLCKQEHTSYLEIGNSWGEMHIAALLLRDVKPKADASATPERCCHANTAVIWSSRSGQGVGHFISPDLDRVHNLEDFSQRCCSQSPTARLGFSRWCEPLFCNNLSMKACVHHV